MGVLFTLFMLTSVKKIMFDIKGEDVGVLVSGPRNLRHEVARICASGLAENLHFEFISFSWCLVICIVCSIYLYGHLIIVRIL
ncbi:hypothetical protein RIF29_40257 [Crotalaria pallida]|uniref:Uncharacterized protein n=1 Tax=Crotalaria pallida TaxID=3830 RepID=A0AAN9E594_CROPI